MLCVYQQIFSYFYTKAQLMLQIYVACSGYEKITYMQFWLQQLQNVAKRALIILQAFCNIKIDFTAMLHRMAWAACKIFHPHEMQQLFASCSSFPCRGTMKGTNSLKKTKTKKQNCYTWMKNNASCAPVWKLNYFNFWSVRLFALRLYCPFCSPK